MKCNEQFVNLKVKIIQEMKIFVYIRDASIK